MLPPFMRAEAKQVGPLISANPLRITPTNTASTQSVFGALSNPDNDTNIFGAVASSKSIKKSSDEVEKIEVSNLNKIVQANYYFIMIHL